MPLLALVFGRVASRAYHQESEIQPTMQVCAFHEKAGQSQDSFVPTCVDSLLSS
jgi:hypothetical protein